jgi:hypothetical protein
VRRRASSVYLGNVPGHSAENTIPGLSHECDARYEVEDLACAAATRACRRAERALIAVAQLTG